MTTETATAAVEETEVEAGEQQQQLSFGLYLLRAREAKGLSLDDVAHLTKVRRAILEALEREARRELPEKVFVLGYVRSYANTLGLNVEDVVRRFNAMWGDDAAEAEAEAVETPRRSWAWLMPTFAACLLALAFWYIVVGIQ